MSLRLLQPPRDLNAHSRIPVQIAEMGRRLDAAQRSSGDSTLITPTLGSGWFNYDSGLAPAGYYISGGRVFLQGVVFATHVPTGSETIFTIPVTFATSKLFPAVTEGGVSRVDVGYNGIVVSRSSFGGGVGATAGGSKFLSLDGISIRIGS